MLMMVRYDGTERLGVNATEKIVIGELAWIFREQPLVDVGIDAHIEIVDDGIPTGKLIAAQIKTGISHFKNTKKHLVYYGELKHYTYWLNHSLPVILIAHLPETSETFWEAVTIKNTSMTKKRWRIEIPKHKRLNVSSRSCLRMISGIEKTSILIAEAFIKTGDYSEAEKILTQNVDILSNSGKIMLMQAKCERGDMTILDMYRSVDLSNVEDVLVQHYFNLTAVALIKEKNLDELLDFARRAIDDINGRLALSKPKIFPKNPLRKNRHSYGSAKPTNTLILSSVRLVLLGYLFSNNLISLNDLISGSFARYGFGVSKTGKFVATPEFVLALVEKVVTHCKLNIKSMTDDDIRSVYAWIVLSKMSIEGNHNFAPDSKGSRINELILKSDSGATDDDVKKIKCFIRLFLTIFSLKTSYY